jgi:hypothetical protein
MKEKIAIAIVAILPFAACTAHAGENVLVIGAEYTTSYLTDLASELALDPNFTTVNTYDAVFGTPSLATLNGYNAVLAFTDYPPADSTGLGNVLKSYVDDGGHVTLMTYAFSEPWTIGGGIAGPGYSPLDDSGVNGTVTVNVVPVVPGDPVFNGVNVGNVSFFNNFNYAYPTLDPGATLLATDGNGIDMLARNAAGNVYAFNAFPLNDFGGSPDFFHLVDNTLTVPTSSAPDGGCTLALLSGGLVALGAIRRKLS